MRVRAYLSIILVLCLTAVGFSESRLESEFKLAVPADQPEAIWAYLNEAYGPNGTMLARLGEGYSAAFATDEFLDRYYDTPEMPLLKTHSGLRHRTRYILKGKDKTKDGRQLVQLKLGTEDESGVVREEDKYEVRSDPRKVKVDEDRLPCVGLVKRRERPFLIDRLKALSIQPEELTEAAVLLQTRRRVYISHNGQAFATITLDHVLARSWVYVVSFHEMELELNEIAYTDADQATRQKMTDLNAQMKEELFTRFPGLQQDQTPKYNKSVERLKKSDPFFEESLQWGFRPEALLLLPLAGFFFFLWRVVARRRAKK
ncbi:MAG: CYTH domain-containing protein [Candidatus Eremiobacteraeota bacterium]|nr:CYTH domain-containing protein [Candidatus Eremiobacteraeota bacterium]